MKTEDDYVQIIQERYSCRNFDKEALRAEDRDFITSRLADLQESLPPFETERPKIRFQLLAAQASDPEALREYGTYGFIKNPQAFIIAALEDPQDLFASSYLLEELVLDLSERSIGTCWLGGTFKKGRFMEALDQTTEKTLIPYILALGYPNSQKDTKNTFLRRLISKSRKPSKELFFFADRELKGLENLESAQPWTKALEALQNAPSAANKQPWRAVIEGKTLHLYNSSSSKTTDGTLHLSTADLGIGLKHLELLAKFQGPLTWIKKQPDLSCPQNWEYVLSLQISK